MLKFVKKKLIPSILAISFAFGSGNVAQAADTIDVSTAASGAITVNYENTNNVKYKILVEKDGVRYTYDLQDTTNVPLQLGSGKYLVRILENVQGTKFKVVKRKTIDVQLVNEQAPFLNSVQNINWDTEMAPILKAQQLTKGLKTDAEKVSAIYNYIVNNIKYDDKKAKTVAAGYIPNINETFKDNTGICYDYASLFAAMLRSVNIPTKLVTGQTTYVKDYHAWNEVYLNGKWVIIDTTVDAGLKNSKTKPQMIKNSKDFKVSKQY